MLAGKKRGRELSEESSEGVNTEDEMIREYGFGKTLFKDEEDERYINSLKELEREKILDERHQKMQLIKEKHKLYREFKREKSSAPVESREAALNHLKNRHDKNLYKKPASESESNKSDDESEDNYDDNSADSYSSKERNDDDLDNYESEKKRGISYVHLEKARVGRSDLEKW
jgi:hypothetical protein